MLAESRREGPCRGFPGPRRSPSALPAVGVTTGWVGDMPGAPIFNGRYRVDRELARGGMAVVYLGHDTVLGRTVVLKVLSAALAQDRGFVERFRREAQAAANLNHPNIVHVYDWGRSEVFYFIVMEYVDGGRWPRSSPNREPSRPIGRRPSAPRSPPGWPPPTARGWCTAT